MTATPTFYLQYVHFMRFIPQDLTENAKIEADRRLHPPTETQVRYSEVTTSTTLFPGQEIGEWLKSALLLVH